MTVELINTPSLDVCDLAISKCWDKQAKDPVARIERIVNKFKHASTAEHIIYQFDIDGFSRAVLQEMSRHRMQSPTVKSSRYTLSELKDEEDIYIQYYDDYESLVENDIVDICRKYLVFTGTESVDLASMRSLSELQRILRAGISNDKAKYAMPEAYKTSMVLTVNARALQNLLSLRTSKATLWEFRELAHLMYEQIPDDHKFLFDHLVPEQ